MTCGSRSSPASASAGSPGSSCWSAKIIIDTKTSVGTRMPSRCRMKRRILALGHIVEPDDAVRIGREALDRFRHRPQPLLMEQVDDRQFAAGDLGHLVVRGL